MVNTTEINLILNPMKPCLSNMLHLAKPFCIFNKKTLKIEESINVMFDEFTLSGDKSNKEMINMIGCLFILHNYK